MVTYKIEADAHNPFAPWVIVATLGDHLSWEVGRYADRQAASKRLSRLREMMRADEITS